MASGMVQAVRASVLEVAQEKQIEKWTGSHSSSL